MALLMCASQLGDLGDIKREFNVFVEPAIELQYCASKSGCIPFPGLPPVLIPTDYFDVTSGRNVCDDIAAFLKRHNPGLDDSLMRIQCKAPNPTPDDFFAIPDIVTHQPGRTEFYEIKPLGRNGTTEGRKKIVKFEAQCGDFRITDYDRGRLFRPDEDRQIGITTWLGMPFKIRFRFRWTEAGLIQWDVCVESSIDIVGEAIWKGILTRCMVAMLFLAPELVPVLVLAGATVSPEAGTLVGLTGSVGRNGTNQADDVRAVQILLGEWRTRNQRPLIAMDGIAGPKTIEAIADFQTRSLGFPVGDGLVEVGRNTLAALEREFVRSLTTADPTLVAEPDVAAVLSQASPEMLEDQSTGEGSPVGAAALLSFTTMLRSTLRELRIDAHA